MSNPPQVHVPEQLLAEGVSIIGIGVMGAAYAARLSSLGVPVTIFNRTGSKAVEVARAHSNVTVARSIEDCARASSTLLMACSPTMEAIASICDQLANKELVRNKHVVFVVDCGLAPAKYMDEVVFKRGGAASVTNVSMMGGPAQVMEGTGLMHASGRTSAEKSVTDLVLPLLKLFATATYHEGGCETASLFAIGGHLAVMPMLYALMHYLAIMKKSGMDAGTTIEFFQALNRMVADMVPFFQRTLAARDYSTFFFSHQLMKDIMDAASETCRGLHVDDKLAALMAEYHQRAIRNPHLASKSFHSVYEVIDPPLPK